MPRKIAKPISKTSASRKRSPGAVHARAREAKPPSSSKARQRATTITLPAECTLAQNSALHSILSTAFSRSADVIVDAGSVSRIDAASLQLLGAFVRDRTTQGLHTRWLPPSLALEQAAGRLGLTVLLHLGTQPDGRA